MSNKPYVLEPLSDGNLFSVPGIRGGSRRTGVKPSGNPDLAVIVADQEMNSAAMFTTNACAAAPVHVSRARLAQSPLTRSIVINSGNANALTGPQGMHDAEAMLHTLEQSCGGPGLVLSTGIIGVPLPTEKVLEGIREASRDLSVDQHEVVQAILTTDTCEKTAAVHIVEREAPHRTWTVGGIAKGSGMIHPNMATMLGIMATNLPLPAEHVRHALRTAVDQSFHRISVDGDTSTNDTVVLLAPPANIDVDAELFEAFQEALTFVAHTLAQKIVNDGEGATRWMNVHVQGARSDSDAHQVATAIACSPLVKTALAGGNPNWGRIMSAAGNANVPLSPENLTLQLGEHIVFANGRPIPVEEDLLNQTFGERRVTVVLDLGAGPHKSSMSTIDLTHGYIEINAEYTT